ARRKWRDPHLDLFLRELDLGAFRLLVSLEFDLVEEVARLSHAHRQKAHALTLEGLSEVFHRNLDFETFPRLMGTIDIDDVASSTEERRLVSNRGARSIVLQDGRTPSEEL